MGGGQSRSRAENTKSHSIDANDLLLIPENIWSLVIRYCNFDYTMDSNDFCEELPLFPWFTSERAGTFRDCSAWKRPSPASKSHPLNTSLCIT